VAPTEPLFIDPQPFSDPPQTKLHVPPFQLKPNVSYLISGGLKGLCGSLAIYMARQGAKNIVALSRSGHDDKVSQSVVHQLAALGTAVDLIRGDVTNIDDVRRAFNEASMPIAGLIQGAMMLRVSLTPSPGLAITDTSPGQAVPLDDP
jgi:NAD(P)-dependent dehydrogenase (short-subunit alcohol dehydrogenase family)